MKSLRHTLVKITIGLQAAICIAAARPADIHSSVAPGVGKQILGGMAYGSGGLLAGSVSGAVLLSLGCMQWGEDCGFAGLGGAFIGGVVGFASAFPMGVYRFGTDDTFRGSWKWTYASALLGTTIGFGGWALATGLEDEDAWFQSIMIGTAAAPIGALIGFNASGIHSKGVPEISLAPRIGGGWAGHLTWPLGENR